MLQKNPNLERAIFTGVHFHISFELVGKMALCNFELNAILAFYLIDFNNIYRLLKF